MLRHCKLACAGLIALLAVPDPATAVITFTQLSDDVFIVSHRVKVIGSRGKATKMVYEKAASLCVAAGYEYYVILDQESAASQEYEAANASVRVKFFFTDAEDRIACRTGSNPQYMQEASQKLQKKGYVRPQRQEADAAEAAQAAEVSDGCGESCSLEQVAAMARAGLTDEQIRAACDGG